MSKKQEKLLLICCVCFGIIGSVVLFGFWFVTFLSNKATTSNTNIDIPPQKDPPIHLDIPSQKDFSEKNLIPIEKKLTGHSGEIYSIAISNNRQLLAVGTNSSTPELWSLEPVAFKKTFSTNISPSKIDSLAISTVAISKDNRFLVGAGLGGEGSIYVWQIEKDTNNIYKILPRQDYNITSLAINSQSTIIASGSSKGEIKLWNLERGDLKTYLDEDLGKITFLSFSHDDEFLIIGDSNGKIIFWNQKDNQFIKTLYNKKYSSEVISIDFNIDKKNIVSSHFNSVINIWDIESGNLIKSLKNQSKITSLFISKDGKTIITGDDSGLINIWNRENQKINKSYKLSDYSEENITLKPENNQNIIVIGYIFQTIKIWRLEYELN